MTTEAERLDAVLCAFEALIAAGYSLHCPSGERLTREQFYEAMTIGLNAVLQTMASPPSTNAVDPVGLNGQEGATRA